MREHDWDGRTDRGLGTKRHVQREHDWDGRTDRALGTKRHVQRETERCMCVEGRGVGGSGIDKGQRTHKFIYYSSPSYVTGTPVH
ncbi:hypothetical protein BgiMline_036725 [Biomphalaria glabrata]